MDAEVTAPVTTPAKKTSGSGCMLMFTVVVGLLIGGFIWNAITGGTSHSKNVTRTDYGSYWPLTVDTATIGCKGADPYAEVGGVKYALNGTAEADGYPALDPVWAADPTTPGLKLDVSALRINALKLC
jgi:hypothetical protein